MTRKIIWQWWKNPFGGGEEWCDRATKTPPKRCLKFYYDDDEPDTDTRVRPVVVTAAGVAPVNVYGHVATNFNFWIGHTNFTLDEDAVGYKGVVSIIKEIDGVESLDVLTRYRFRIGFGLGFNTSEVIHEIEEKLEVQHLHPNEKNPFGVTLDEATTKMVRDWGKEASRKKLKWCVFIAPNNHSDFFQTSNEEEYRERMKLYNLTQSLASGVIYASHDNK